MKFTIKNKEFLNSLLNVSRIIPSKSIDPILSNIKLEMFEDRLEILGSDGELSIKSIIKRYKNNEEIFRDIFPGSILLNAKIITEIIRRLDDEEISFYVEDNSLAKIKTLKSEYNLNVIRGEEFRELDFDKENEFIEININDLKNAVEQTSYAASTKSRPILQCVNIENDGDFLYFVGTDGLRLARKVIPNKNNLKFNISIQARNINEIIKTETKDNDLVKLYVSANKAMFEFEDCFITTTLTLGEYPNTKTIVPHNFKYILEVNSNEFLKCLDRAVLLSHDRENIVKLSMSEENVEITSKSQEIGDAKEQVELFKYSGERLIISFNVNFVTQAIKTLKSSDITIKFLGEMKPFTVSDKNDENIVHLITPVKTY